MRFRRLEEVGGEHDEPLRRQYVVGAGRGATIPGQIPIIAPLPKAPGHLRGRITAHSEVIHLVVQRPNGGGASWLPTVSARNLNRRVVASDGAAFTGAVRPRTHSLTLDGADRSRGRHQPESLPRAGYVVCPPRGFDGSLAAPQARPLELDMRWGIRGGNSALVTSLDQRRRASRKSDKMSLPSPRRKCLSSGRTTQARNSPAIAGETPTGRGRLPALHPRHRLSLLCRAPARLPTPEAGENDLGLSKNGDALSRHRGNADLRIHPRD